jgi:uncharacterized membrane protein
MSVNPYDIKIALLANCFAAWQWALEGQKLKGILLMHLVEGCASGALIWSVLWIHWPAQRHPEKLLPRYRLPIEALAVLLMGLTGHLGGLLSGVNPSPRVDRYLRDAASNALL